MAALSYVGAKVHSLSVSQQSATQSMIVGLCSALLFFLGAGVLMESWFVRYGATYQITLPISFVVDVLILEAVVRRKLHVAKIAIILLASTIIVAFHAMEFLYVVIFGAVTVIFYRKSVSPRAIGFAAIGICVLVPILLRVPDIWQKLRLGFDNGYAFDKATFNACCSGFVLSSLCLGAIWIALMWKRRGTSQNGMSSCSMTPAVIIFAYSLLMIAIPLPIFSRMVGFVPAYDVFRFYFGSMWFLIVPLAASLLASRIFKPIIVEFTTSVVFFGFVLIVLSISSHSTTQTAFKNARSLVVARDENRLTNWNSAHVDTVRDYLKGRDMRGSIFLARSDIALIINMLGGFTSFEDVQAAVNGRIVTAERRAIALNVAPAGYKLVTVPDLFPMDDSLKSIGWESSVVRLRPKT
ncbi:hypothetical protein [Burkholderia sp. Bp9015]|uniref:hypothetical protein n=1 Tax=Burkholderia sp. Bp9015 TaxID=2184563 RepID=UPI000F5B26F6|nr:hypothetical protein [Burkholderia sp. Bp9015]